MKTMTATKYAIKMPGTGSLWCTDGEWHHESICGPGGYCAKTWATRAGASRWARQRWNMNSDNVVEVVEVT